jgi:hypothetical protein
MPRTPIKERKSAVWPLHQGLLGRPIGDEFEQAPVRIAEIEAGSLALGSEPSDWPGLHSHTVSLEVSGCLLDRPSPDETKVTVARFYGNSGYVIRKIDAGAVDVQLCVAEPVGDARVSAVGNDFGPNDLPIEPIRNVPVRDTDDAVVEAGRRGHADTVTNRRLSSREDVVF